MAYVDLLEKFQRFDTNSDGTISLDELKLILQDLDSSTWTDEAVNKLLRSFDANQDGCIQYEEFVGTIMKGQSPDMGEIIDVINAMPSAAHRDPSESAKKAHESVVKILTSLNKDDRARVHAMLLRDLKQESRIKIEAKENTSTGDWIAMDSALAETWDKLPCLLPDEAAFPEDGDPDAYCNEQIASGEIDKAAIKFKAGDEVMTLSSKDDTEWIFSKVTVLVVLGNFQVGWDDRKTIYYLVEWADGYDDDQLQCQERLKSLDGLKFCPGQDVEVQSGSSWIACKIGESVRFSHVEPNRPLVYKVVFRKGEEIRVDGKKASSAFIRENGIREKQTPSAAAKQMAKAESARNSFINKTFPNGMPDYYGC